MKRLGRPCPAATCQHAVDSAARLQPGFTLVAIPPLNNEGLRSPFAVVMLHVPLQNAAYVAEPYVSIAVEAMSGVGQLGVDAVRHSPMSSVAAAVESRLNTRTQFGEPLVVSVVPACVVSHTCAAP